MKLQSITMLDLIRICDQWRKIFRKAGKADRDWERVMQLFAAWLEPRLGAI